MKKGVGTARLRLGRRVDGIYRDVVAGKRLVQHVYVWKEEWAVVSRDDVDGDSPISSMSSHRRKVQTTLRLTSSQTIITV